MRVRKISYWEPWIMADPGNDGNITAKHLLYGWMNQTISNHLSVCRKIIGGMTQAPIPSSHWHSISMTWGFCSNPHGYEFFVPLGWQTLLILKEGEHHQENRCKDGVPYRSNATYIAWLEYLGSWLVSTSRCSFEGRPTVQERISTCLADHGKIYSILYNSTVFGSIGPFVFGIFNGIYNVCLCSRSHTWINCSINQYK